MKMNKYWVHWMSVIGCVLGLMCHAVAPADEKRPPARRYRVIFNCDGHAVAKDSKGDLDQWIENLFGPLADSHVDALFWCDGAGGNTANYSSQVLELTGKRIGKPRPYIAKWINEGNDPPKVVVREAKKRGLDVFYSFRINDIHDSFTPDELPMFKIEHPEWQIGERKYGRVTCFPTALNFTVREVRELKFRVIEEIFQKYDFDGLEIDWMRGLPYFLPGKEPENAQLLTELLQRVREHLNERGQQRGRPIRLAVRVGENLEACRLDGLDVPAWIDKGLIDYLILSSGVIDIDVEEFKRLAALKDVLVYPCLYGWPSKYRPSAELHAALALNYWHQGADGIYLFNWFPHTHNNSQGTGAYMSGMLKQIGDSNTLRANQRHLMFPAERGRPWHYRDYPHNFMHSVLPTALPGDKALHVSIQVGEDFRKTPAASSITLKVHIENLHADDGVEVMLNGKPVQQLKPVGDGLLTAALRASQLLQGRNKASLRLSRASAKSAKARTATALEIDVRMGR